MVDKGIHPSNKISENIFNVRSESYYMLHERVPLIVIIQFESSMSQLTRFSYNPEYSDIIY